MVIVVVKVVVDVDPDEYRAEYSEDYSTEDISSMVKADIHDSINWNFVDKFPAFKSVVVE